MGKQVKHVILYKKLLKTELEKCSGIIIISRKIHYKKPWQIIQGLFERIKTYIAIYMTNFHGKEIVENLNRRMGTSLNNLGWALISEIA